MQFGILDRAEGLDDFSFGGHGTTFWWVSTGLEDSERRSFSYRHR